MNSRKRAANLSCGMESRCSWNNRAGVLEVIRPLRSDVDRTRSGLVQAFGWMSLLMLSAFGVVFLILRRRRT